MDHDIELFTEALELLERLGGDRYLETLLNEQIALRQQFLDREQCALH